MRVRLRAAALVGIVAVAASVAGCGETVIDKEKVDDTAQSSLEKSLHEKIKSVDCPSDQAVDPGSTFECEVLFPDGRRDSLKLKIRDKEADISAVGLKQIK